MGTIILFILVLSLLVFVHELGHFFMARRMGMRVEEFGFGFPPKIFGVRRGATEYSVNWIPLGGFVRIKGESGDHRFDSDSFASKAPWKRFLVLIAGVVMNLVLAAALFSVGYMVGLPSVVDGTLPDNAVIADENILLMSVLDGSPAEEAGLVAGDELVSVDNRVFENESDVRSFISEGQQESFSVVVEKADGTHRTYDVVPAYLEEIEKEGIGVGFVSTGVVSYPFFSAVGHGVTTTGMLTWEVIKAFYDLIRNLVVHQEVGIELSGPVGIAVMTGEVAALGFVYLIQFTAILSINLAIINAFPFPALDGGRILFLLLEKIRGKTLDDRIENLVHNTGFLLLMLLVVMVTFRDFFTFGDQILGAIKGVIGV
jgi:regulator of sigma E protease